MLELRNISKDFDGLHAVSDVSLKIPEGQIIGLIGPNGSGKSTLLNVISSMMPPSKGEIIFDGDNITHWSADAVFNRGLARGFQDPALFFKMTVLDNLLLPAKAQRGEWPWYAPWRRWWQNQEADNAQLARDVLTRVDMLKHMDTPASDLSGGQMKLLDIARCLMGQPKMLLLDEPAAGVAPALAYQIFEQIHDLRETMGITFFIVEHRLEILFDFADSVYVMHMGQVVAHDRPENIVNNQKVREIYLGG